MIAGFGRHSVTIGSAPGSDICLGGAGVAPSHARVERGESGQLVLIDLGQGPIVVNGAPLPPGGRASIDFRSHLTIGGVELSMAHPAFALMLLAQGEKQVTPGSVTFGRDPARVNIVVEHPNVSGLHATFSTRPLSVEDHGSTSGTWVHGQRLPQGQPIPLESHALLALGPVPIPVAMVVQLADLLAAGRAATPAQQAPPASAAPLPGAPEPVRARHKTVVGQIRMGAGPSSVKSIGRTPDNDIVLESPQVSSRHALLHTEGGQLFLEDRGSANGTYVRGERILPGQKVPVQNGEKVLVGPMPLLLQVGDQQASVVVEDSAEWAGRAVYEIEAWDLVLQVPDRDNPSELKTLLDHVSFKALPGDLIALMGPSGAGKTTLLLTLNGYLPPTFGQVRINGEDLYSIYDALRGSIGYVPQDDIVHPELTVWEAVRYSAKFRLPPDYSDEEIDRRVQTTLAQLGLDSVAHLQIGRPEKKILSGGQRKRVNIAMELVTDPVIMFLDEPTSGLAADDTTALVQLLSDLARGTGKTIITTIHQPAKDEYEKFNLALILGQGGLPIYFGPTTAGYRFFGSYLTTQGQPNTINNPRDMFDMLNRRERPIFEGMRAQDPNVPRVVARRAAAEEWNREFFAPDNPIFQQMFSGRRAVGAGSMKAPLSRKRPPTRGQFGLLFSRYWKVKFRDGMGTAIMLLQAPIIGVLLAFVFGGQKDAIPFWCLGALQELGRRSGSLGESANDMLSSMRPTADHAGAIFFLVVAAVWFGTSNAAREIVSERAIYRRERMVNLKLFNYVLSKFVLLAFICVVQCAMLLSIVFFALGFHGGAQAFMLQLATMVAVAVNSVTVGLLLSALVESSEAAMALTPIALIPQVVLGGLMVPMTTNPLLEWPMLLMPARWGFQGVVAQERLAVRNDAAWLIDVGKPDLQSPENFVFGGKFHCAEAQIASVDFNGAWGFSNYAEWWVPIGVLGGILLLTLLFILGLLKRRDSI
jgi:ABC-type multidrug transport system ATPase subunit/pSer/pThr/pTyr-binding forkhead associated (FHA) protein